ncbi:pleckstrin homology domain-containing family O member 1b [Gouania willdenowi]|nr:pleckstrin homology domain-containing family O member 1-like [Gouania willdenowi]
MKKNQPGKRGLVDSVQSGGAVEKSGWIRKFCGRGIFREIWKNRFVALRGDQLLVSEKEVKDPCGADEVMDLTDFDRCEDFRKKKNLSKKNLSKFKLQRCSPPGTTVPNLLFLALSPEDKESWIMVLNAAIIRAKNRILDQVTVGDCQLFHPTRDRVKIPHSRRRPTRAHLLAVASSSSSDGTLTFDLIGEEAESGGVALPFKSQSLFPDVSIGASNPAQKNHCVSTDKGVSTDGGVSLSQCCSDSVLRLQQLIDHKVDETERLLMAVRQGAEPQQGVEPEAIRLLREAAEALSHAQEVLQEVMELRDLYRQLNSPKEVTEVMVLH